MSSETHQDLGKSCVLIDEVQFFDYDIVYLVQNNRHVNFYLSGLETDFKKAPFGFLNLIKSQCKNNYIWHDMNCQNCGYMSAQWNYRKVKSDNVILVGDKEYLSVCSPCFDLLEGK
jgi:thymidine kinase